MRIALLRCEQFASHESGSLGGVAARKAAGLNVEDRISLELGGDPELLEAARAHEGYVVGETLATSIAYECTDPDAYEATIEGRELRIRVERAG